MNETRIEMGLASFRRYCESDNSRPSGTIRYYSVNDRQRTNFPANRLALLEHPNVEIAFKIDYIAFSFNPNRILLGNPDGTITFNRVEKIILYSGQFCGDTAYIFCKGSDTVYCIQFDRH